jgi:hypothetical protein
MAPGRADTRVQGAVPPGVAVELRQLAGGATTNVGVATGRVWCYSSSLPVFRHKAILCCPELQWVADGAANAAHRSYE